MKKQISVLLVVLLLLLTALPASAETTAKSIPFSGWAQGETGNAFEPNAYIPGIGQVVLCQTADDLTAYLQAGEYPLDYAETYGYDADFFAEKSLLLLEVGAGRTCDLWYVTNITQIGQVLNCNLLYYEPDGMGPALIYSRIQCVELNQKPTDIERLRVNVTYDQSTPRDPVSLEFAYTDATKVYMLGDVNGNGYIDAADALLVLRSTVIKMPPEDYLGDGFLAANVDGEGWPSSTDALLILKKVVGKIRHFPAEITEIAYEPWQQPSNDHYVIAQEHAFAVALFNNGQELTQGLTESLNVTQEKANQLSEKYTDEFFQEKSLLAFTVYAPCTGAKYMVNDLYAVGDTLYLDVSLYDTYSDGLIIQPRVYFVELAQTAVTQTMADFTLRKHFGSYGEEQLPLRVSTQACTVL